MLALYCGDSLIASVLPTASRASQRGAPAVCLICHCSVDIRCERKKKKQRRNGETERERLYKRTSKLPEGSGCIICFLSLSASCSSRSQRRSMVYSTRPLSSSLNIVLLCLFPAGDDTFTAPRIFYACPEHLPLRPPLRFQAKGSGYKFLSLFLTKKLKNK